MLSGIVDFFGDKRGEERESKGIDTIIWNFAKEFTGEDGLKGYLQISYQIDIRRIPTNCEANQYPCYRFLPKVSYYWNDDANSQRAPFKLTVFYKLDYGSNTGLTLVHDADNIASFLAINLGRQAIQTTETKVNAVTNGQTGQIDNIHTVHVGQSVFLPGCRFGVAFDCVHVHWRWSESEKTIKVDPMTDPSNDLPILPKELRGTPYLVKDQTIDIAIVNSHPGEDDPDDPFTIVNNEQIATAPIIRGKSGEPTCYQCILTSVAHLVVWYIASGDRDNFFGHGFFVLDTTKYLPPSLIPHSSATTTSAATVGSEGASGAESKSNQSLSLADLLK